MLAALPFAFVQSALIAQDNFPRTPSGKPDFSGNYDTSSLTPYQRPAEFGDREFLTAEEVKEISDGAKNRLVQGDKALDPDRAIPEAGINIDLNPQENFWWNFDDSASAINGNYLCLARQGSCMVTRRA